jgi:hypothetical protein
MKLLFATVTSTIFMQRPQFFMRLLILPFRVPVYQ